MCSKSSTRIYNFENLVEQKVEDMLQYNRVITLHSQCCNKYLNYSI